MRSIPLLLIAFLSASSMAADQKDYLPLKVGNEWTTNAEFTTPKMERSTGTGQRKVEGKVERGGKTYFRIHTKLEGGPTPIDFVKLVRKDETGFYSTADAENAREQKEIVLPLKAGQTWQTIWGAKIFTNTVIGLETVIIGEKTYDDCYHIRTEASDKSYSEDYWEAPKVGNVKSEVINGDGSKMTLILKEFKAGK